MDHETHRFVVDAKGKDKRGNGTAGAKVTLSMVGSEGATAIEVLTDLAITGKPAQFGRGVMQDVSDKLLGQFVACLEQRLATPETAPPPEPTPIAESVAAENAAAPSPAPAPRVAPIPNDDSLDLGAAMLPVLAKSYWRQAVGVLAVLVLLRRLQARRRRRRTR